MSFLSHGARTVGWPGFSYYIAIALSVLLAVLSVLTTFKSAEKNTGITTTRYEQPQSAHSRRRVVASRRVQVLIFTFTDAGLAPVALHPGPSEFPRSEPLSTRAAHIGDLLDASMRRVGRARNGVATIAPWHRCFIELPGTSAKLRGSRFRLRIARPAVPIPPGVNHEWRWPPRERHRESTPAAKYP